MISNILYIVYVHSGGGHPWGGGVTRVAFNSTQNAIYKSTRNAIYKSTRNAIYKSMKELPSLDETFYILLKTFLFNLALYK